ncbi:MAG: AAA family ATPase [Planctomycetes bacterium]|nr:AAA family ATPase [Planctomycetota bacterium]
MPADARERAELFRRRYDAVRQEIGKVIVGQGEVVDTVLRAFFAGGNVLLEGVPGLGKTMLVRTLADAMHLDFARIQFTPDLMPADIVGTTIVSEDPATGRRALTFQKGPIFANIVLADEVNRATPKTQSALLEAMQEHSVTVGGVTRRVNEPFLVIATQNPIDMEGTYPLPEAQLDRFLVKVIVRYATREEMNEVLARTTRGEQPQPSKIMEADEVLAWRRFVRDVALAPHVADYASRLVLASHPDDKTAPESVRKYVRFGSSPRGAQGLILLAKVRALLEGRYNVSFRDVSLEAPSVMRHRLIRNFEAEADRVEGDQIVTDIVAAVPQQDLLAKG